MIPRIAGKNTQLAKKIEKETRSAAMCIRARRRVCDFVCWSVRVPLFCADCSGSEQE